MKRLVRSLVVVSVLAGIWLLPALRPAWARPPVVLVDGTVLSFPDQAPYIDGNGRTLVPVRFISESLGSEVDWDGARRQVIIWQENGPIILTVGEHRVLLPDRPEDEGPWMDTTPVLTRERRTMVPLRFLSEFLGATVLWDPGTHTATVTTQTSGAAPDGEALSLGEFLLLIAGEDPALSEAARSGRRPEELFALALRRGWLGPSDVPARGRDVPLSAALAAQIAVRIEESRGFDRYPDDLLQHHDTSLTRSPAPGLDGADREWILRAHAHGFLDAGLLEAPADAPWDAAEAAAVAERIREPGLRWVPLWSAPEAPGPPVAASFVPPQGTVWVGDTVETRLRIAAGGDASREIWAVLRFRDGAGDWFSAPARSLVLEAGTQTGTTLSWQIPAKTASGRLQAEVSLWDRDPGEGGAECLARGLLADRLLVFRGEDRFETLDRSRWSASSFQLERTRFRRDLVGVADGKLQIRFEPDSFAGGELRSVELFSYGAYEIRMKLPDAPSSVTGFFLFRLPSLHHEIDIEVYNEPERGWFLATYTGGARQNIHEAPLPFDPTGGYHTYRMEYEPGTVSYYLDDEFVLRWDRGVPDRAMHLLINAWFPDWLEGIQPEEEKILSVDYIRY